VLPVVHAAAHEMAGMQIKDKLRIIHAKVQKQLEEAYEISRQRYDKRNRMLLVKPGQEVFRRNFVLSDFSKSFNAKFSRKFFKARVVESVGSNAFLRQRHPVVI